MNLLKCREIGKVDFIDGLRLVSEHVNEDDGVLERQQFIETLLSTLRNSIKDGTVVIIDKISLLNSLGFTSKEIFKLASAYLHR